MTSSLRVFAPRCLLAAAFLASACQHDSNASFDDSGLMSPDAGGAGATDAGGSDNVAGGQATAGASANGGRASAGASQGGKPSAGSAGGPTGGKPGAGSGGGGRGGTTAGGSAQGGKGGAAGSATGGSGSGSGGTGGSQEPEPMTFVTVDIDDTDIASCMPNSNFGLEASMNVDGDLSCKHESLVIAPLQEIPEGALVSVATLTLTCFNVGDPITVSYVNEAWKELSVHWNTRPALGMPLGSITCAEVGDVSIDLTSAVKAWLSGAHEAYGIYLRTEGTNGSDFRTSESNKDSERPLFSVTYTVPMR